MVHTLFDAHCDTFSRLVDFGGDLAKNSFCVDLERMCGRGGGHIQVFAAFVDKRNICLTPLQRVLNQIDTYHCEIEKNCERIEHCTTAEEAKRAVASGKCAAFLSVEGGEALEGRIENLRLLYRLGVRLMTLTWNYQNEICDGIGEERGAGLTEFGKKVVSEMNKLGMIVDVSHISRKGFWEVAELCKKPMAVTHTGACGVFEHPRNLTDEQIRRISADGGCIGVCLYPEFLKGEKCAAEEAVRHIEHILSVGGEDCVGIGTDFDGISESVTDICHIGQTERLADIMLARGYSENLVRKIMSENFLRLMRTMSENAG